MESVSTGAIARAPNLDRGVLRARDHGLSIAREESAGYRGRMTREDLHAGTGLALYRPHPAGRIGASREDHVSLWMPIHPLDPFSGPF